MGILRISQILRRAKIILQNRNEKIPCVQYWEERARAYGERAVLNLRHQPEDIDNQTKKQKEILFASLKKLLTGEEKTVLDFGCGPGRFTGDLANIIGGFAVGIDPVKYFIELAPKCENIQYKIFENGRIGFDDSSFDIVWICLVLGGVVQQNELQDIINEINRVLKQGGLLFLVENTSDIKSNNYWKYRPFSFYKGLCPFVNLTYISEYLDFEERISIMAGRKYLIECD